MDINSELQSIKLAIANLEERLDDMGGYAKEIDGLSERISQIENHLGVGGRIAA